jgi:hypothetical protein
MGSKKKQLERAERELAQLRKLVRDALGRLGGPPDLDDDGSEYAAGYRAASGIIREAMTAEVRPSQRKELISRAAVNVGLEPGGRGTGHLAELWDSAYEEGARNAITAGPLL